MSVSTMPGHVFSYAWDEDKGETARAGIGSWFVFQMCWGKVCMQEHDATVAMV